jgi:hypothetical protein
MEKLSNVPTQTFMNLQKENSNAFDDNFTRNFAQNSSNSFSNKLFLISNLFFLNNTLFLNILFLTTYSSSAAV